MNSLGFRHCWESKEEIWAKLRTAPLDLSVKIAAAIGCLWEESEEDEES